MSDNDNDEDNLLINKNQGGDDSKIVKRSKNDVDQENKEKDDTDDKSTEDNDKTDEKSEDENYLDKDEIPFDAIVDRVGIGMYHWIVFTLVILLIMAEAAEVIVISVIQIILQIEWDLEPHEISYLIVAFFVGITFGQLTAGYMAKSIGRFLTLMSMAGVSFSFALVSAFSTNFWFFIFCRAMLGFSGGILLPVGCSILVEMVPTQHRTKVIAFIVNGGVGWIAGELFAISLAYVFLDNLQEGNWRGYLIVLSLTLALAGVGIFFFINDSPRHFLMLEQNKDAVSMQKFIAHWNGVDLDKEFGPEWADKMIKWQSTQNELRLQQQKNLGITSDSVTIEEVTDQKKKKIQ